MAELEHIVHFLDQLLDVGTFPDYPNALNGLQVAGPPEVGRVAACVDVTEASVEAAREAGADLMLVHHGLFWGGLRPIVGPLHRKLRGLFDGSIGLYSAHLPLDAHPDVGNCALLARAVGVEPEGQCGSYKSHEIGWWGTIDCHRDDLKRRLSEALHGDVRLIAGGPERLRRVAVVTGGGGSFLGETASRGMDALVTGEASHHSYHEAMELGVNLYLGGHYATETWGVRALAQRVAGRFDVEWTFLDLPTGL